MKLPLLALLGCVSSTDLARHMHPNHMLVQVKRSKEVSHMVDELSKSTDAIEKVIEDDKKGHKHKKKGAKKHSRGKEATDEKI
jgi:hypothetical protein